MAPAASPRTIASLTTTVPSEDEAQALARGLVEARLAACVQVESGLQSHDRWQGQLQAAGEVRLTVKTLPQARAAVETFVARYHPYELPQLLWQTMDASSAYADWVREQVDPALSGSGAGDPPPV
jgi:periplasmic divalent cation tolerance protein